MILAHSAVDHRAHPRGCAISGASPVPAAVSAIASPSRIPSTFAPVLRLLTQAAIRTVCRSDRLNHWHELHPSSSARCPILTERQSAMLPVRGILPGLTERRAAIPRFRFHLHAKNLNERICIPLASQHEREPVQRLDCIPGTPTARAACKPIPSEGCADQGVTVSTRLSMHVRNEPACISWRIRQPQCHKSSTVTLSIVFGCRSTASICRSAPGTRFSARDKSRLLHIHS